GVFDYYCYGDDNIIGSNVKINDSVTAFGWACVDTNSKAVVTGDLTQNNQSGGLNGDLTVGGDYINLATAEDTLNKYNVGTFVSGKLTVNGNVLMNDLVLNYNNFEQNIAVAGTITANRKTDVILLPVEEDAPAPVYVIGGEEFPEPDSDTVAYIYSVPFYRQLVELTIGGEAYAMKVNDRNTKAFVPVKVSDRYSVAYDTGETAFKAPIAPETFYYPELGLDLPPEEYLQKIPGLLFGGWYDNAAFEGEPITAIPVGAAGDKTVYLKLIVCDHAASTAQPTCTETAVCTVCGLTLATVDHAYGEVTYVWSEDLKQVTASAVCAFDETHVLSETVETAYEITESPSCTAPGLGVYTAVFSNGHFEAQEKQVPVQALGHDTVQHEAQAPTCTEPGWAAYETCTRCDYTTFVEIPQTGHTNAEAVKENDTPATCIEYGGYDMVTYCAVCGEELTREHYEYDTYGDHSWGEWAVTREPTDEEDGLRERTCTVCGATESEFISSDEPYICPLCGEIHTGFIGLFLGMWHNILFILGRLTYIIK
ncbi:MAG: hypothetical protein IKS78_07390, partial [Clostridia bacterium]|nr:hypothetical protein [Clostridia bacterium]